MRSRLGRGGRQLAPLVVLLVAGVPGWARADAVLLEPRAAIAAVLDRLDERLSLMPAVAAAKWQNHAPLVDPDRERLVIAHAVEAGAVIGLAAGPVGELFALHVKLARESQRTLADDWARHGFTAALPIPDLDRSTRPRLDQLTSAILRALYLAAPDLTEPNLAARFPGLAEERLRDAAWSASSRAAVLEALAAVRRTPTATMARIRSAGVLRIGTTGDYAPYSVEDGGRVSGADIELAQAIASRLALEPVFIRTRWGSLLGDLRADRFDLALGGVSITAARAAVGAFSAPYASGGKTIIARCRDARRYRSLAALDRASVRLIVNPGGANEQFVIEHIHHARVLVDPDNRSIFQALVDGAADAMITDDVEVELQTRLHPQLCRPTRGMLTHAQKAILMPREPALLETVNSALAAEIATGNPARWQREFLERAGARAAAPK